MADEPTTYPYGLTNAELILLDAVAHSALMDALNAPHPNFSEVLIAAAAHRLTRERLGQPAHDDLLDRADHIMATTKAAEALRRLLPRLVFVDWDA